MSSNFQQAVKVRRVSLQLNSNGSKNKDNRGQSRASLCYSSNLKKRTDALSVQRAGINQFLQKTQSLIKPMPQLLNMKTISSSISPKRKGKNITPSTPSQVNNKMQQKGDKQINLQRIEVNAKSIQIKSKQTKDHFFECSQKNNKSCKIGNFDLKTIPVSQMIKEKMITQPIQQDQPLNNIRQMVWSAKIGKSKRRQATKSSKNKDNRKMKTQGTETVPSKNLLISQRIINQNQTQNKKVQNKSVGFERNYAEIVPNSDNIQFLITQISNKVPHQKSIQISKIPLNSNRLMTATISSQAQNPQKQTITSNSNSQNNHLKSKPTYKTSQINLSQHFAQQQEKQRELLRQRQGLFSGFPVCKRANMSSFNKYYQNIIKEVKKKQKKLKKQMMQNRQKDLEQQQIQQDYHEEQLQDNIKKKQNRVGLSRNITLNMENYDTVKSINIEKCILRNHSLQSNNYKFNNFTTSLPDRSNKVKNIDKELSNSNSNSKLIHSIHKNSTKNQNVVNNVTNPSVTKNIKMYQNNNMVWFQVSNHRQQNMDEFQVKYTICKKKELLERPPYAEEYKKKVMKSFGKGLGKKFNTQALNNQGEENIQVEDLTLTKLRKSISKKFNQQIKKRQKDQPPLGAWDVLQVQHEGHDENFQSCDQ